MHARDRGRGAPLEGLGLRALSAAHRARFRRCGRRPVRDLHDRRSLGGEGHAVRARRGRAPPRRRGRDRDEPVGRGLRAVPEVAAGAARELRRASLGLGRLATDHGYDAAMCRSIHTLYNYEPAATDEEVRAAALQYVRTISGSTKPSRANEEAFARAVDEVHEASRKLLASLVTTSPPRDREVEAERKRARAAERFAAA